ncbi:MAG: response regulator [Actinobacteria bacterium]|nr:MAG: response regulator [Actinomycetota bacterium]
MSALSAIVCDDDPEARQVVSRLVSACGFEVAAELDLAVSAVAVAEVIGPTVVLLDLSFPGLSSLKAIPLLREAAPGCEVVVCSAYETVRPTALRSGATEVVDKGDLHRLEQVLKKIAELRGATSGVAAP